MLDVTLHLRVLQNEGALSCHDLLMNSTKSQVPNSATFAFLSWDKGQDPKVIVILMDQLYPATPSPAGPCNPCLKHFESRPNHVQNPRKDNLHCPRQNAWTGSFARWGIALEIVLRYGSEGGTGKCPLGWYVYISWVSFCCQDNIVVHEFIEKVWWRHRWGNEVVFGVVE